MGWLARYFQRLKESAKKKNTALLPCSSLLTHSRSLNEKKDATLFVVDNVSYKAMPQIQGFVRLPKLHI